MKYKVGDKVIIKKGLIEDRRYGNQTVVKPMLQYLGKEATIKYFISKENSFNIDLDSEHWCWTAEMFDPKPLYKVGDQVLIKDLYKESDDDYDFGLEPKMREFSNKICTIKEVRLDTDAEDEITYDGYEYKINEDDGFYTWSSDMFVGAVTKGGFNAKSVFNVGDKVVIRNDLIVGKPYDTGCLFTTQMQDYCNKLATIINCYYPMLGGIRYHLDIDRGKFAWSSDMLLLYSENSQTINQTTNQTTNQNENQLQRKEACISRGDQYTGRRVLYTRRKAKISVGHLSYKEIAQRN